MQQNTASQSSSIRSTNCALPKLIEARTAVRPNIVVIVIIIIIINSDGRFNKYIIEADSQDEEEIASVVGLVKQN